MNNEDWKYVAKQFRATAKFAVESIEEGKPGRARGALQDTLGVFRDVFTAENTKPRRCRVCGTTEHCVDREGNIVYNE